ncbi:MAG: UDP-N-acetylmuramate dehydrogenase [Thermodesulfobacteriota bacterium]
MEERHRRGISRIVGRDVRFDRPMRLYTTLRIGGNAAAFAGVKSLDVLKGAVFYAETHGLFWTVLGKGSNLLVSDEGIDGLVIRLQGELAGVSMEEAGTCLRAGGGATIRRILDACARDGLGGLEFLAGIPGTAGGAVAMNAGARDREVGDSVKLVQLLAPDGKTSSADTGALSFSYRRCALPEGALVTGVLFRVERESPDVVRSRIRENLEVRRSTQPLSYPSAGSVFRNPPGDAAGRLVEQAGLKGKRIGGAEISTLHANFIVNRGGASAKDVLSLMKTAREEVFRVTGIELESEVRMIGFRAGQWPGHGFGPRGGPLC